MESPSIAMWIITGSFGMKVPTRGRSAMYDSVIKLIHSQTGVEVEYDPVDAIINGHPPDYAYFLTMMKFFEAVERKKRDG